MILDIILILLIIIVGVIGYKVGFLTTLIKLTSALSGLIIAICLTKPITTVAVDWGLDSAMEEQIYQNITSSEAFLKYTEEGAGVDGINSLLQELGIPPFVSGFVAGGIVESIDANQIARSIADGVSYVFVFIIVFLILLLFSSIIFWLLKLFVKSAREKVGFIRILDGSLGVIFFLLIFLVILYLLFLILSLILQGAPHDSDFVRFFVDQLHLEDGQFGIAKYLYENNLIGNFFGLLF